MTKDNNPADDVYETDERPEGRERAPRGSWFRSRKGKISIIAASGLVLLGATAAAGIVGTNLANKPDFGGPMSEGHHDGDGFRNDHQQAPEGMDDGYGARQKGFGPSDHHGDDRFRGEHGDDSFDAAEDGDFDGDRPGDESRDEDSQFTPPQSSTDSTTPGTKS